MHFGKIISWMCSSVGNFIGFCLLFMVLFLFVRSLFYLFIKWPFEALVRWDERREEKKKKK